MTSLVSESSKPGRTRAYFIVIVDEKPSGARELARIVAQREEYRVCGTAHDYSEAMRLIRDLQPDVLLLEPFLENCDALQWIRDLVTEFSHTRVLVVSSQAERIYAERALRAGASGYWMKKNPEAELLRAISTVAAGEIYVSRDIASLAVQRFAGRSPVPDPLDVLSEIELAIFSLIAMGEGVAAISKRLGISKTTVQTHCKHLGRKLGYPDTKALNAGAREYCTG